ncbi:hypothetical protein C8Q77DRAFT_400936 [Trametes polyzona]|nr:hypothetical protein C8Q77DRAFT_400936 [Trametes polyzona]
MFYLYIYEAVVPVPSCRCRTRTDGERTMEIRHCGRPSCDGRGRSATWGTRSSREGLGRRRARLCQPASRVDCRGSALASSPHPTRLPPNPHRVRAPADADALPPPLPSSLQTTIMRVCSASAARVLSLFSLALLSSHSFILANAQDTSTGTDISTGSDAGTPSDSVSPPVPIPSSITTPVTPTSSSVPPTSSAKPTSSPPPPPPSTSSSTPASSSAAVTSATSSSQASSPSSSDASSASQTSSSSIATSSSSLSSSSSALSTSSSTAASTSSTGVTVVKAATTLVASSTPSRHVATGADTTSYGWLDPTSSATDAAAAGNVSAAHKGFFDNKGAVAGTFSVVGVVALGAVIVGVLYAKRRAARLQDEEDMAYFEKYNNGGNSDHFDGTGDLSFGNENPSEAPMTTHAAPGAYPDRSMHYGLPSMEEYAQPQHMDMSYGTAAAMGAGMEYPAGTAYARAQAQQGQYQYDGYAAYNTGADYNAQYQEAYYDPRHSPTHPYADPRNSPKAEGAPQVQPHGSNADLVQGEAR